MAPSPEEQVIQSMNTQLSNQLQWVLEHHMLRPKEERKPAPEMAQEMRELLQAGADPMAKDSLLLDALSRRGLGVELAALLEFCPPLPAVQLSRLLQKAIMSEMSYQEGPSAVIALLNAGAPAEDITQDAISFLHYACIVNPAAVPALLGAGANLHASAPGGETPLHYAASTMRLTLTQFLLEQGADPLALDKEGRTPREAMREERPERDFAEVDALLRAAEHHAKLMAEAPAPAAPKLRL